MANPFTVSVPSISEAISLGEASYKDTRKLIKDRNQEAARLEAGRAIQAGDIAGASDALVRAGDLENGLKLIKMRQEQEAGDTFSRDIASILSGNNPASISPPTPILPQAAPGVGVPSPAGNAPMLNPPVPSSGRVWGDNEAEAAGLYEKPTSPLSPSQPSLQPMPGTQVPPQISTGASIRGVPLAQAIPTLLRGATNPNIGKGSQALARDLLLKAIDQYPSEIRQLEIFKQRPDLYQMAIDLKRAGATSINTTEGMDAAQAKARIAIDQTAAGDIAKKVTAGRAVLPLVNRIIEMGDKVPGGWAGAALPGLAKAATSLGIPVTENMSNAELLNAATRQFIPAIRDPGSTANYEQQLYMQSVPSLSQTPEGRVKIARMFKAQIERNAEILATYRKYVGSPQLDQKLAELDNKPLFSAQDRALLERAAPSGAAQAAPSLNDIDAEIRRRGLR